MQHNHATPFMLFICSADGIILAADPRLPDGVFRPGANIQNVTGRKWLVDNAIIHTGHGLMQCFALSSQGFKGYIGMIFREEDLRDGTITALAAANRELEAILDSSHDGIVVADNTSKLIRINHSYERITGIPKDEILGLKMQTLVDESIVSTSATLEVLNSGQPVTLTQTFKTGVQSIITGSPVFDADHNIFRVITNVRDMTEINQLREELAESKKRLDQYSKIVETLTEEQLTNGSIVFKSRKMQLVKENALKFAKVDAPILITGESGVGKEVVADLVYKHSSRKGAPFLKINCGAIPESLLESELFGYESGAFSGARREGKAGLFEMAHNGTVMLDEIGDLSPVLQVKLLRFVQHKEFYKIGGKNLVRMDVRLIAATNRDLEEMVNAKQFRADLFYRLNVLKVTIPPLRERPEDIIPLSNYFLKAFNAKYRTDKKLAPEVYRLFTQYPWHGNVRELENLIERLVVVCDRDEISADYLPEEFAGLTMMPLDALEDLLYRTAKEEWEQEFLRRAVHKYRSSRKVAQILGLDHSTIVKKAAKYGIKLMSRQEG